MSSSKIPVRSWRIMEAEPHGLMMWFDPRTECPELRHVIPPDSDGWYEGGALGELVEGLELEESGTHTEEGGSGPPEGREEREGSTGGIDLSDLPF